MIHGEVGVGFRSHVGDKRAVCWQGAGDGKPTLSHRVTNGPDYREIFMAQMTSFTGMGVQA